MFACIKLNRTLHKLQKEVKKMYNTLAILLAKKRMNAKKLSEISGVSIAVISELYHLKKKNITVETMLKICKALNCSPNDFLFDDVHTIDKVCV